MLDEIREYQRKIFDKHDFQYKRYFYDMIDFSNSMIGIVALKDIPFTRTVPIGGTKVSTS